MSDFGPMATQTSKPHSSAVGCDFLDSYEGAPLRSAVTEFQVWEGRDPVRCGALPENNAYRLRVDSFCGGERDDFLVDEAETIGDHAADAFTSGTGRMRDRTEITISVAERYPIVPTGRRKRPGKRDVHAMTCVMALMSY